MARKKIPIDRVEQLEEQIGLLLEKALDLAVGRPPPGRKARIKHLGEIRGAAADAISLADAAIVLLKRA